MSEFYTYKGITITPQPGGYYELAHPSLPEPVRERGKEKAEQRADEIAAATALPDDDSHIAPQGALPDVPPAPEPVADFTPTVTPDSVTDPVVQLLLQQNQQMQQQMSAMMQHVAELSAAGVRTVGHTEGEAPVRLHVPSTYAGEMDPETRERLEAKGIKVVKIILEENESIPPTGLFISHNGRPYMLQPGVPVDVPDFLVGILDTAVMSAPIVNAESKKVIGYRDRLKYAYRRVD